MTNKTFIHSYTNNEIPMEFVMKFDNVLQELVDVFAEVDRIIQDEIYTDAEIFAEKYSDF